MHLGVEKYKTNNSFLSFEYLIWYRAVCQKTLQIAGSIIGVAVTVTALTAVFSIVSPGPFSSVLDTLQGVRGIVLLMLAVGVPAVGLWLIEEQI